MDKHGWQFKVANNLFIVYAVYLCLVWIFINYGGRGPEPYTGSGKRWFIITFPLLLYILLNLFLLLVYPKIKKDPIIIFLFLYIVAVLVSSLIRLDIKHFSEVIRWALPVMLIVHFKVKIPLFLLNGLYLFALAYLILTFDPMITDYGYLPGQTTVNLHQGLWWRISIWSYNTPPYSAAFSMIVFFANYFLNKGGSRYLFYGLALYFIIFSGSRTSYLIFLICCCVLIAFNFRKFLSNKLFASIPILLSVLVIFGLQFSADLIPLLGIENQFFNSAILRNDSLGGDAQNLSSRFLIISEHFRQLTSSGISGFFGIGSEIYSSPKWTSNGGLLGGSTDSYISHLIARDGIAIFFLLMSFIFLLISSMRDQNLFAYIILLALLMYTIGYGAWLNLTSPVFVFFLGFLWHHSTVFSRANLINFYEKT